MGLKCDFGVAEERSDGHVFDLTWPHGILPGLSFFGSREEKVDFRCSGQRGSGERHTLRKRAGDIAPVRFNRGDPGSCG